MLKLKWIILADLGLTRRTGQGNRIAYPTLLFRLRGKHG